MSDDLECQRDELEALQSIYNTHEFKINEQSETIGGQFFAYIELPPNFKINYRFLQSLSREKKDVAASSTTVGHTESFEVEFLPPIILYVTLPANYPSQAKPDFLLACKWLSRGKLSVLCRCLDELWEETPNMEILFKWTQFLKEESLQVLKIKDTLDVSPIYTKQMKYLEKRSNENKKQPAAQVEEKLAENMSQIIKSTDNLQVTNEDKANRVRNKQRKDVRKVGLLPDERTVFDLPLSEPICTILQQYNIDQRSAIFSRTMQECNVCFSSKLGSQCIQFRECAHVFCKLCIAAYFQIQVQDGNVKLLKCLADKCDTEATPDQVKSVLSEETFTKYEDALLAATLDTMSDIVYCPRRSCQYPVTLEPEETMGRCPSCQYVFCIYCKMVFHGVEPCRLKSEEQKKLVNDYQTGDSGTRSQLEKRYGRLQLQRLVDTTLSEQWVSANSQNCPHCHVSIEKSSGCNKMACWRCNTYFCWLCQAVLSHTSPYLHFNNPLSRCFNRLFEGVTPNQDDEDDDDFWLDFDEL